MNIEYRATPIEHWIVDGKAYRLATEKDVGKECYRSDYSFENAIDGAEPVQLKGFVAGHDMPYQFGARWRFAYVQDDSLLTPQRTPVPALGDGWYLLRHDDGEFIKGDKVTANIANTNGWVDPILGSYSIDFWLREGDTFAAARYFGPVSSEPQEIQPNDTHDTPKPIDWTKPVRTKDGRAVRVLCTDGPGEYPVVGLVDGMDEPRTWTISGQYFTDGPDQEDDLENVPQRIKREYWVNVYPDGAVGGCCSTKEGADGAANDSRLACVKITIDCEEGEGL